MDCATVLGNPTAQEPRQEPGQVLPVGMDAYLVDGAGSVSKVRRFVTLASLLFIIFIISNLSAVVWVTLGNGDIGWVRQHNMDQDGAFAYFTALHWAMCQYTFATMEVVPVTTEEQAFACILPFIMMVTAYPLVAAVVVVAGRSFGFFPPAGLKAWQLCRRIIVLMVGIFLVMNVFALIWWAIGESDDAWLERYQRPGHRDLPSGKYWTVLHWTLAQFTWVSMEVVPTAVGERIYTILIQLIGLPTLYPMVAGVVMSVYQLLPGIRV